ncbi:hypothetical protein ACFSQE_07180 [Vogesella fluminis]|uniref:Uncharacterized protein n=1 Tax=Vogesella fluminis TaxID=1069161 RepID=A0ABQ3H5V9_9NEIS|nr:hypothetical protein [Vogesella fluminis]GHD72234.1 hypothetical protein GCM10011419_05200 [Vogesella fluminis]
MVKVTVVGPALPVSEQLPRTPELHHAAGGGPAVPQDAFRLSLLAQHAQQLDPDEHPAAALDLPQLEAELAHLLQLLEERLYSMRERALLDGGHPSYGLLQELQQVSQVLQRVVPLWLRCARPAWREAAAPRLAGIFNICHFVSRAVMRAGERSEVQSLQQALQQSEQVLR